MKHGKVLCIMHACVHYKDEVCLIRTNHIFNTRNHQLRECPWFEVAEPTPIAKEPIRLTWQEQCKVLAQAGCPANNTKCLALISGIKCCKINPLLYHGNSSTGITCGSYRWELDK